MNDKDRETLTGITTEQAVEMLDAIDGEHPYSDHEEADDILLNAAAPEVRAAYAALVERSPWWETG